MTRLFSALLAMACCALVGIGMAHHPFHPWWPAPLVLCAALFAAFARGWWLTFILALLPVLDLGQYSGFFFLEDIDFAILSAAAAGYLRLYAFGAMPVRGSTGPQRGRPGVMAIGLYLLAVAVSMLIALWPLAPLDANAFAHYFSRYNALRVGKSPFIAMLLMPLLWREFLIDAGRARQALVAGLALAFGLAGVSVVWERMAFVSLTDFSSDFRATGMFAATNTGGAALDAMLIMTMPFCLAALLQESSKLRFLLWACCLALGGYAVFVTFSRSLYGAAVVVLALQLAFAGIVPGNSARSGERTGLSSIVATVLIGGVAFWLLDQVFAAAGYRGTAAVAGSFAALYLLSATPMSWKADGLAFAIGGALVAGLFTVFLPFGAYLGFALAALAVLTLCFGAPQRRVRFGWPAALLLSVCAVLVAANWGGQAGLLAAGAAAAIAWVLALLNLRLGGRLWRVSAASMPIVFLGGMGILGGVVAMHSWYAGSRFETTADDWAGRVRHWNDVAAAIDRDAVSLAFGMGVGRMPEVYFWRNGGADIAGSFSFANESGNQFLRLSGGRYAQGYGDPLKIMQLVRLDSPRLRVAFDVRTATPSATFEVAVCARHVIYAANCQGRAVPVAPDNAWHRHTIDVDTSAILAGTSIPRPVFLVFFTETQKSLIDVDNLEVNGVYGESLANGGFSSGMDHWFFTSDRAHLAWHAKNALFHILFEQGVVGVVLLAAMVIWGLARLWAPMRTGRAGAVALAGAFCGFLMVGAFDSLFDAPRVAYLFYALVFGVLTIPRHQAFGRSP